MSGVSKNLCMDLNYLSKFDVKVPEFVKLRREYGLVSTSIMNDFINVELTNRDFYQIPPVYKMKECVLLQQNLIEKEREYKDNIQFGSFFTNLYVKNGVIEKRTLTLMETVNKIYKLERIELKSKLKFCRILSGTNEGSYYTLSKFLNTINYIDRFLFKNEASFVEKSIISSPIIQKTPSYLEKHEYYLTDKEITEKRIKYNRFIYNVMNALNTYENYLDVSFEHFVTTMSINGDTLEIKRDDLETKDALKILNIIAKTRDSISYAYVMDYENMTLTDIFCRNQGVKFESGISLSYEDFLDIDMKLNRDSYDISDVEFSSLDNHVICDEDEYYLYINTCRGDFINKYLVDFYNLLKDKKSEMNIFDSIKGELSRKDMEDIGFDKFFNLGFTNTLDMIHQSCAARIIRELLLTDQIKETDDITKDILEKDFSDRYEIKMPKKIISIFYSYNTKDKDGIVSNNTACINLCSVEDFCVPKDYDRDFITMIMNSLSDKQKKIITRSNSHNSDLYQEDDDYPDDEYPDDDYSDDDDLA